MINVSWIDVVFFGLIGFVTGMMFVLCFLFGAMRRDLANEKERLRAAYEYKTKANPYRERRNAPKALKLASKDCLKCYGRGYVQLPTRPGGVVLYKARCECTKT